MSPSAWVTCPCSTDPSYAQATAQAGLSLVQAVCSTFVRVTLARRPRIGTLVSIEFMRLNRTYAPAVFVRVAAVNQQPGGSWLAHCEWTAPMTEDALASLLKQTS
jgi:hypothetical protein